MTIPSITPTTKKTIALLNLHFWSSQFWCSCDGFQVIQANVKTNDVDITILFGFTLRDVVLQWGKIFI
jgi:hypothetical protein